MWYLLYHRIKTCSIRIMFERTRPNIWDFMKHVERSFHEKKWQKKQQGEHAYECYLKTCATYYRTPFVITSDAYGYHFEHLLQSRFVRQSSSSLYYVLRAMIFLDIHTCICNVQLHIPCKRLVELSSYNKNQKIAWSFKWLNHLSYSFITYKSLLYRN